MGRNNNNCGLILFQLLDICCYYETCPKWCHS